MDVGTIFVSPIINSLIEKVSTYCSDEIALVWGVKGDLEKLSETLELIYAVLHDAEKRQLENNNRLVKLWLEKLKDVALDAEDILDELQYEDLRRKMKNKSNILRLLPSKPFGFGCKIAHKIKEVSTKLDGITKNMKRFNFISHLGGYSGSDAVKNENIPERSSHIIDSAAVVGRENDLSNILDLLSNCNQESYSVVRITGMGGIGKTTLAQLVYADNMDHFQIKIWVSVSRKSNEREIFGELLESIGIDCQSSLNVTKDRLKEKLMVGKCLIVLDDVWTNHGIGVDELLKDLLSMSCEGSKILITMRSTEDIPPMTDRRYIIYQLQGLPEDDCWSIISNIAFGHGGAKKTPDLINIGKQIARKCGGLPLAAKSLGGLLYSRNEEEEWLSILNSQSWELPTGENKIVSLLKLSYDHLSPPYVKRCFSYCSIFPKGHDHKRKELIRMWMAEGFINSSHNASAETVGNKYFNILLRNSFFQDERRNKGGDIKSCRMHDLVHDLAISVAGSVSLMVKASSKDDDPEVIMQLNKCRHLGLQVLDKDVSAIPSDIYKASKLHTLACFDEGYCNWVWVKQILNLSLLRVLILSRIGIEELPRSICNLKHLRHLDLTSNPIISFPRSFSKLYNLQVLKLKECHRLERFPTNMRKLINLEYFMFNNRANKLTQMPRGVSRFSKLKKLSRFMVGTGKGYGIEELKDLNLLGGKLIIDKLGRVTDARQANLIGKKNIARLELRWDSQSCDDSDRNNNVNGVINDLQPHPNLKRLTISRFGGSKLPTWMGTSIQLPSLVYVSLDGCDNCELLPALGRLQSLRYLSMESMDAIKKIGPEFYQSNGDASFPSLVELYLVHFYNLEEWLADQRSTSTSSFSCLETLEISGCPKLSTTPTRFPSLKNLSFEIQLLDDQSLKFLPLKLLSGANSVLQALLVSDCDAFQGFLPDDEQQHQHYQPDHLSNDYLSKIEILKCPSLTVLPADFSGLNSLTYLAIEGCGSLQSLPVGIEILPALHTLIIGGFSEDLESFPFPTATASYGERYFATLRDLKIRGWRTLKVVLPDQLQHVTSLYHLSIRDFPCLLSLPEWFGKLSSLQTLDIENCSRLEYLPSEEQMLRLTSLQIINIRYSPLLLERCRFPNEEWHKIAHLKQVSTSSPSLLDHIPRNADMNEELETRRRSGIFSNQNKEKCWVDSSGRKCFMLFPRSWYITWGENTNYWTWLSIIEPSTSDDKEIEMPELVRVCWLDVQGKLDMSKLSPGVNYEVVFVVMFQKRSYGWEVPVNLSLELSDGKKLVQKVNLENMPKSQWIEIHVGEFRTPQHPGDEEKEVHFRLFEIEVLNWKKGLVIEGAIVRPK